MKIFVRFLLGCAATVAVTSCSDDNNDATPNVPDVPYPQNTTLSRAEADARDAMNEFGFDLLNTTAGMYDNVYQNESSGNILISPVSAGIALAMVANSCDESSAERISGTLHCDGLETLNSLSNKLIRTLSYKDDIIVRLPNSIWYRDDCSVSSDFSKTIYDVFCAEVNGADFDSPATVGTINSWASSKTNGLIPTVLNDIDDNQLIIWINAMYARGEWANRFETIDTKPVTFNGRDTRNNVAMMTKRSEFGYYVANDSAFEAVSLPFKGEKARMIFILPAEETDIDTFSKNFAIADYNTMKAGFEKQELWLTLPKFTLDMSGNLCNALTALGIPDLPYIYPVKDNCQLNTRQFTSLKIDEQGAEAAAATVVGGVTTAAPDPDIVKLTFDRPFMFVMCDDETGAILMAGRICNL